MIKMIKRYAALLSIAVLLLLMSAACRRLHESSNQPFSTDTLAYPAPLPPPSVQEEGSGSFTEQDLFTVFGLKPGMMSASEAAKKVESGMLSGSTGFTFEARSAESYDDEQGTFTVKVKGRSTASAGVFEKIFTVKGFPHLYAKQIWGIDTSGGKGKLKFDVGIEDNLSIEKFIERANTDNGTHIKDFFEKNLTFSLYNAPSTPRITVELGDHEYYSLTAVFRKETSNTIKIIPTYTVKMYKKTAKSTLEERKMNTFYSVFNKVKDDLIKPYFTEQDVFQYVLGKTTDDFIKSQSDKCASSIYALATFTSAAPADLFDMQQIQSYIDKYQTKDENEHLAIHIEAGIYNPKNGGIEADDTAGILKVQYCIANQKQIEHQITGEYSDEPSITAISEKITKNGFKTVSAEVLKDIFAFKILKQGSGEVSAAKKEWISYPIGGNGSYSLVEKKTGSEGVYTVKSFPPFTKKKFYMTVNDNPEPAAVFADETMQYISKGQNDVKILLTGVMLQKKDGDKKLTVTFILSDGKTVDVEYIPLFSLTDTQI